MNEIIDIVSQVGFPSAVTVYLLYERDRSTRAMLGLLTEIKTMLKVDR